MGKIEPNITSAPQLYSVSETAKRLCVSVGTVRNLIRDHRLATVKVGSRRLVPDTALIAFVQRCAA